MAKIVKKWVLLMVFLGTQSSAQAGFFHLPITSLSSPESKMANELRSMKKQGTLPVLDVSDTLLGTDRDAEGVRDDIQAYVEKTYLVLKQKRAAMQKAAAMQKILAGSPNASRSSSEAIACLFSVFEGPDPHIVSRQIEALTFNTPKRKAAYAAYNASARSGTASNSGGCI